MNSLKEENNQKGRIDYCEKSSDHKHRMKYLYTWLISYDTGFITNIVDCIYCGYKAQTHTMYHPDALSVLSFVFRKDTIHRRIIKGEIVDKIGEVL